MIYLQTTTSVIETYDVKLLLEIDAVKSSYSFIKLAMVGLQAQHSKLSAQETYPIAFCGV